MITLPFKTNIFSPEGLWRILWEPVVDLRNLPSHHWLHGVHGWSLGAFWLVDNEGKKQKRHQNQPLQTLNSNQPRTPKRCFFFWEIPPPPFKEKKTLLSPHCFIIRVPFQSSIPNPQHQQKFGIWFHPGYAEASVLQALHLFLPHLLRHPGGSQQRQAHPWRRGRWRRRGEQRRW